MPQERIVLGELGEVRGGQVAKAISAKPQAPGAWRALQAGDLNPDGSVTWPTLRWVMPAGSGERSVIKDGDVLVPLRSTRVSAMVARGVPPRTIAVGHWAVITTKEEVLPDYLAWYLTHPIAQRQLASQVVGSNIPFVPLSAFRELTVEIPPLAVQEQIVRVHSLHRRLTELDEQAAHAREQYVNAITRAALERSAQPTIQSDR